jgi:hypothetical protein
MGCDKVARPGSGLLCPVLPIRFRSEAAWSKFLFSLACSVEFIPEAIDHEFLFPFVCGVAILHCQFTDFLPKIGQGASSGCV